MIETELYRITVEWNTTATPYPRDAVIHELFEGQAAATPSAIAVEFESQQLSYRDLNRRANQLAHYLQQVGVGPEVMVGICAERSVELIVGILGILKAGGAYVPLDPDYPPSRLAYMLSDTRAPVLLTQSHLVGKLPPHEAQVICLDRHWPEIAAHSEENPRSGVTATNLAYVIYTSGSTGRPKGTTIPHRGVVRLVKGTNYADLGPNEVFLQFAPISFDASTFELWGSLLNGAKLVVFSPQTPSLAELGEFIEGQGITTLWLTSALFTQMVDTQLERLTGVRQLLAGGDVLSAPHVKRYLSQLNDGQKLINGYGPTENTTFTCCHVMDRRSEIGQSVPIGKPISNTTVYILDEYRRPVPVGVQGELYTGRDGLARGYLNQPDLTSEKFIENPFSPEPQARLYRTGDSCRWLEDGTIEFCGRRDLQVKIRGFRVEPGEIEAALRQHPAIQDSVVLATGQPMELIAYIVPIAAGLNASQVRDDLRQALPSYMLPSHIVPLESFPLTSNGKIDRGALPGPDTMRQASATLTDPRSATEKRIVEIWRELLSVEEIGVHDNFFELGGHSLMLMQVDNRLQGVFHVKLKISRLFSLQTVAELAAEIDALVQTHGENGTTGPNEVHREAPRNQC